MSDMQIAVRLRRKPGAHRLINAIFQILVDHLFNKIPACRFHNPSFPLAAALSVRCHELLLIFQLKIIS